MATKFLKAPKMKSLATESKPMEIKESHSWDPRPNISFTNTELPEIKTWKVGEKYNVMVEMVMKTQNNSDKGTTGSFTVSKVGVCETESMMEDKTEGTEEGMKKGSKKSKS